MIKNPDTVKKYFQTGNKDGIRKIVYISEYLKKLAKACGISDKLFQEKYSIPEVIGLVSQKTEITKYPVAWYCLVRAYKPKVIVQTETSMGWSSFMILSAISRNNSCHLHSFDLDDYENVKNYDGVGYLIPEKLKENWTLIIGDTKEKLEPVLKKLKNIDMFIHDSEHSYEMMMHEYSTAWKHLKKDGILGSDDINHSNVFEEFAGKYVDEIYGLIEFVEIPRNTDNEFKRPRMDIFLKKPNRYFLN